MFRELRGGDVGKVLLQQGRDLRLRCRIEPVMKGAKRMCRRHEDQAVELVAGAGLVERFGKLVDEAPLLGAVQILARLDRMVGGARALADAAGALAAELARAMVQ